MLQRLAADGRAVGTAVLDFQRIESFAREYVRRKMAEGRYQGSIDPSAPRPTYDLILGREIIP